MGRGKNEKQTNWKDDAVSQIDDFNIESSDIMDILYPWGID